MTATELNELAHKNGWTRIDDNQLNKEPRLAEHAPYGRKFFGYYAPGDCIVVCYPYVNFDYKEAINAVVIVPIENIPSV